MSLQEQIQTDMKAALRAGERQKVDVLRMTLAALNTAQMQLVKQAFDAAAAAAGTDEVSVDRTAALSDQAVLDTLKKEAKRRRESATIYRTNHRADLADVEEAEAVIIESYLPRQLSADELRPQVAAAIAELGATSAAEMGKVMPALMQRFKASADGKLISQLAREILAR
jgi:uncharacterized protein